MSEVNWTELLERLSEPFPVELVEFRAGATTKDKKKAMALAYVDLREYMKRLDQVCGSAWENEFTPWGDKQVICSVTIHGKKRSSTGNGDGGGMETGTTAEAQAFKRACVMWGLGRYLYEIDASWVDYDEGKKQLTRKPTIPAKFHPKPRGAVASPTTPTPKQARAVQTVDVETGEILTLPPERSGVLLAKLKNFGVSENQAYQMATVELGRNVRSFTEITEAEGVKLWYIAKKSHEAGSPKKLNSTPIQQNEGVAYGEL